MQYQVHNQPQSENALINADKENVKRGALLLLKLGVALLLLAMLVEKLEFAKSKEDLFWIYFLPLAYILTSIIGLRSVSHGSKIGTVIYSALLIALIIINIMVSILTLILFINLASSSLNCNPTKSDACGLQGTMILMITILSLVSFIASVGLAFLLFKYLKNVRKLNLNSLGFQMAEL